MRSTCVLLAGAALIASAPASAADQLKFGPAPAWVAPQAIPPPSDKVKDKPIALLLHDQQVLLEPGRISTFSELAYKIQKPEGLAAGNLSVAWNPAFDTATVNRLEIRRGDQVIDVLKSGQTFTTMRRESNLELAMLDGVLTANIQPEGLQEGDVIVFAYTNEHFDPVLKGHVETAFAPWGSAQIGLAHARIAWPSSLNVKIQRVGDLPAAQPTLSGGNKVLDIAMRDVEPLIAPKGAPLRYKIGRLGEATDFKSWADAARLMMPLYRDAAVIPATGPLRDEVEKIRKASADPKVRAGQALQLVQQRIRYLALAMGEGGLVPAKAEETWSRRFGDCKAKTALLLAILHEFGIEAEPVLANAFAGDAVGERLPMLDAFNHVLVRAHVGGKDYWLDGTRTGDTSLDSIEVPDYGWALPLVENAQLVHMVPAPLQVPSAEHNVSVDATAGVFAPATIAIEDVNRGDTAVQLNTLYSALSTEQRDEQFRDTARGYFDDFSVASSSYAFDRTKRELKVAIKGTAKLNWKDSWFSVPTSSIAFNPDFDRPAGPSHDAPLEVSHPRYVKDHIAIRLPAGFAAQQKLEPNVHETLAGVEYARTETVAGDILTVDSSERSIAPEVPYKDALAAAPRLRALDRDNVYLQVIANYHSTPADLAVLAADRPLSAEDYITRAINYLNVKKLDEALADLNAGIALDPKNIHALIMRASAHVEKGELAAAEADVSSVEAIDPVASGIPELRALIATRRGDWPRVIEAATKALAADPKNKFALQKRSWAYVQKKDYAAAERDLAVLDAIDPANVAVPSTRAAIAERKQDWQTALGGYTKALQLDPNDEFALVRRGLVLVNMDKNEQALPDLNKAIALNPKDSLGLVNRAMAEYNLGQLDKAEVDARAALTQSPKYPAPMMVLGDIARKRGDFQQASQLYAQEIAAESPLHTWEGYDRRANLLYQLGRPDEALKDSDQAIALGAKSTDLRVLRVNILMKGQRDAVAAEAEAMMRENPTSNYAFVAAGKTYAALGQQEKAVQAFDRALAIKPEAYIYLNRSQIRPASDLATRMADVDAALKLEPDFAPALAEKARLLMGSHDYSGAVAILDTIKPDPDDQYTELQRATALYRVGRTSEARKLLEQLDASAKTPADFNSLCWAKATGGILLESALEDCRQALKLSPGNAAYEDSLGMALLKLGKLDEALDAYNRAIATKNAGADSLMGRAFVYLRKGDRAHADADAAAARKLYATIDDQFAEYGLKFDDKPASTAAAATKATTAAKN